MDDFLEPDLLQDPDLSLSPWTDVPEPFGDEGGQWSPMETQPFGGEQAISAASTAGSNTQQDAPRRAKMKRREHRKSRAGCFNCKSRKIKCQETQPACENCRNRNLACVYPSVEEQRVKRQSHQPLAIRQPQATPTQFTMTDMRLFHHFLINAYPHLPLGNDSVWIKDVPIFAHQYEYLMHAMLALAGSHLTALGGTDVSTVALSHRHRAVQGLNEAMSRQSRSGGEYDAMLATCYALTFDSSYSGDGLLDFITMVRGCALMTDQIRAEQSESAFSLTPDGHYQYMEPYLASMPVITGGLVDAAFSSFEKLRPLCQTNADRTFHSSLINVMYALKSGDSRQAYLNFTQVYGGFYNTTDTEFRIFTDPNNCVAQILLAHFIAVQTVIIPLAKAELSGRSGTSPKLLLGTLMWAEDICHRLAPGLRHYIDWPMTIVRTARAEVERSGRDFPAGLISSFKAELEQESTENYQGGLEPGRFLTHDSSSSFAGSSAGEAPDLL